MAASNDAHNDLEGWLTKEKSSKGIKMLGDSTKRYFKVQVVQGSGEKALCYFKNNTAKEPRGWIFLRDITEIQEENSDRKPVMVLVFPQRTMRLTAPSRPEHWKWVKCFQALCPTAKFITDVPDVKGGRSSRNQSKSEGDDDSVRSNGSSGSNGNSYRSDRSRGEERGRDNKGEDPRPNSTASSPQRSPPRMVERDQRVPDEYDDYRYGGVRAPPSPSNRGPYGPGARAPPGDGYRDGYRDDYRDGAGPGGYRDSYRDDYREAPAYRDDYRDDYREGPGSYRDSYHDDYREAPGVRAYHEAREPPPYDNDDGGTRNPDESPRDSRQGEERGGDAPPAEEEDERSTGGATEETGSRGDRSADRGQRQPPMQGSSTTQRLHQAIETNPTLNASSPHYVDLDEEEEALHRAEELGEGTVAERDRPDRPAVRKGSLFGEEPAPSEEKEGAEPEQAGGGEGEDAKRGDDAKDEAAEEAPPSPQKAAPRRLADMDDEEDAGAASAAHIPYEGGEPPPDDDEPPSVANAHGKDDGADAKASAPSTSSLGAKGEVNHDDSDDEMTPEQIIADAKRRQAEVEAARAAEKENAPDRPKTKMKKKSKIGKKKPPPPSEPPPQLVPDNDFVDDDWDADAKPSSNRAQASLIKADSNFAEEDWD